MEGVESDALRAYSRIQSLLDLPDSYGESNYLLETPLPEARRQFSTPHSSRATGMLAKALETPAATPAFATEVALYNEDVRAKGIASLSINEESFERKLHPDEQVFHELLQQTMRQHNAGGVVGTQAADNFAQAEIAGRYAFAAQERFVERAQEARRYGAGIDFGSAAKVGSDGASLGDRKTSVLQRGVQEQRAERDLWSLLETLTAANLMYDVDEAHCEELSQKMLSALPVTASITDYLQAAFAVDDRLRKGAVLKDWIEKASLDLVTEAPAPRGEPWSETLSRVLKSRHGGARGKPATSGKNVLSLHPDGQLTEDGGMLALDGVDRLDQESLLKSIWQLVRCGLISRAQELAAEHRLFWLSASLQGIATHSYKTVTLPTAGGLDSDPQEMMTDAPEEVVGVARVGNLKQPMWLRTCWLYATKLAANPDNLNNQLQGSAPGAGRAFGSVGRGLAREDSLVGVLELSIYAALCNHTKVLLASPLVPAWQDKVWVMLKAAHERDVARIVHQYRSAKASHSKFYAGCDAATLSTERELFDLAKAEIGHITTANCVEVFHKIPPPAGGKTAEFFLLNLQAAVMEGRSGILNYIENTMSEFFHSHDKFPGRDQVVRVFCHFCIWLKYAHGDAAALSELLSLDMLYLAVEKYIDLLIENKQRSLVAAYAAFLNRPRRIAKYAQLLQSMQTSTSVGGAAGQSADATEVLQLANIFFPADVMEITRTVVEGAHSLPSPVPAPSATSAHKRTPGKTPRAPPLLSITSPVGAGQQTFSKHSAAKATVRFALADSESAEDFTVTPSKFSVRHRTATPRPLRTLGDISTPQSMRGAGTPSSAGRPPLGGLPGTPQVGSELLMATGAPHSEVDGDAPLHIRLRAADASQGVSAEDTQQLESLRWLFFETSHRIEAVKQANRFASSFLLHRDGMKIAQVRLLLADYVPLDSIAVGDSLIAQRQQSVTDVEQQYLYEHGVSTVQLLPAEHRAHVAHLREELDVDEKVWDAQVCRLRLWQDFTSATQDVDMFYRAVAEYQAESSRLLSVPHPGAAPTSLVPSALGRHRSKITRTASTAADAVLRALTCRSPPGGDAEGSRNPADGFKDLWEQNEFACTVFIVSTARMLEDNINALAEGVDGAGEEINTAGWTKIDAAITALWDLANEVYPLGRPEAGEAVAEHPVRVAVAALAALELPQVRGQGAQEGEDADAMQEDNTDHSALSDAALSVVTALSQCRLHLSDVRDGKLLAGGLLFQLLTTYIQVCMSAGSVLQSLAHSRDAAAWYGRAMQLADLIAAEDHSLQLYTLLHRDDLEALLMGINAAALALLAVDPDMHILPQPQHA